MHHNQLQTHWKRSFHMEKQAQMHLFSYFFFWQNANTLTNVTNESNFYFDFDIHIIQFSNKNIQQVPLSRSLY